jgi:hypothetical protein
VAFDLAPIAAFWIFDMADSPLVRPPWLPARVIAATGCYREVYRPCDRSSWLLSGGRS